MEGEPYEYVVISPEGAVVAHLGTLTINTLFDLLGGPYATVPSPDGSSVFVREDRRTASLAYNWAATTFLRNHLGPGDRIHGIAVVAGAPDDDGNLTSLSPEVREAIRPPRAER